ncbi:MAG: acetolactate synthase small subunit [Halodesulfurarchaeum sp.]
MSGGLNGPGPYERQHPGARRTPGGTRIESEGDDSEGRRAVLSALVVNEPGVTAEITGLFARRQVNIERIVGEPLGDGEHSRITFVLEPPHPGVDQVTKQVEKLLPVVEVEELDLTTADEITASVNES